jgi:uncharacterized protein YcbX
MPERAIKETIMLTNRQQAEVWSAKFGVEISKRQVSKYRSGRRSVVARIHGLEAEAEARAKAKESDNSAGETK